MSGADDAEDAIKKATLKTRNSVLSCDVVLASDTWPEALAGGLELMLASAPKVGPSPSSLKPGASKSNGPKTPADTETAIKKLGGYVKHEGFDDKKPIVEVRFDGVKLTDDYLAVLSQATTLKKLYLENNQGITAKGVKRLRGLTNLEVLSISRNRLTDDGLTEIENFKKLTRLFLFTNRITDKGLIHLKDLPELKKLSLSANLEISDAGLEHLKGLKKLERLDVSATRVTDKGKASLKKALLPLTFGE